MEKISKEKLFKLNRCCIHNYGAYGECFLYNNEILKVFHKGNGKRNIEKISENIKYLMKFKMDGIAFPTDIVDVEDFPFAYTMPIIDGINFADIIFKTENNLIDYTLENILKSYNDAILKAQFLTDNKITIFDLNDENCKITSECNFGLFDMDFYDRVTNSSSEDYIKNNILEINKLYNELFINLLRIIKYNEKFDQTKSNLLSLNHTRLFSLVLNDIDTTKYAYHFLDDLNDKLNVNSLGQILR